MKNFIMIIAAISFLVSATPLYGAYSYFLSNNSTYDANTGSLGPFQATMTGKPGSVLDLSTGDNKCGSYMDGMGGWLSSTNFLNTADAQEKWMVFIEPKNSSNKDGRQQVWIMPTPPSVNHKLKDIIKWDEPGNDGICNDDDCTCEENGVTYYKYRGTVVVP